MKVFILFEHCNYSEEDNYSEVVCVYRSREDAEYECESLSLANVYSSISYSSISYFVEPFKVY